MHGFVIFPGWRTENNLLIFCIFLPQKIEVTFSSLRISCPGICLVFKICWTDSGTILTEIRTSNGCQYTGTTGELTTDRETTGHLSPPFASFGSRCWSTCFLCQRFPIRSLRFHWVYNLHIPYSDCPSYFCNCCARKLIYKSVL